MLLKVLRYISLFCTALATGAVFSHLLQSPVKFGLSPTLYLNVQQTLYQNFGRSLGLVETIAFISTLAVLFFVRKRRSVFIWTLAGLISILAMIILWTGFVSPINTEISRWTAETLPTNWIYFRDRWEAFHAVRAIFAFVGLSSLIIAILNDTGTSHRKTVAVAPKKEDTVNYTRTTPN